MVEFEPHQDREETNFSRPNNPSSLAENVGLSTEEVLNALHQTSSLDEAREFVLKYLGGVRVNIEEVYADDAADLTRRQLIDHIYFSGPKTNKLSHPSYKPIYLIVQAMEEVLSDEDNPFTPLNNPQDLRYIEIVEIVGSIESQKNPEKNGAKLA